MKRYYLIYVGEMQSIHSDEEYEKEYKEQFKNMTDEQIEQHIGLEKVRNVMEGFDENSGIDKIRKLVDIFFLKKTM